MSAHGMTGSPAGEVYEVFAKNKLEDTLHHIGTVFAPDAELGRVYAFTIYQEWAWAEMIIAPRHAIISIIQVV
jgi:1,2-phenylacetyl-CoA epoxidase PaaB subunit